MAEQITLGNKLREKQTHVLNRKTRFAVRQENRTRPEAWRHSCARVASGAIQRHLARIDATKLIIEDQLAAVGETLSFNAPGTFAPQRRLVVSSPNYRFSGSADSEEETEETIFDLDEAREYLNTGFVIRA